MAKRGTQPVVVEQDSLGVGWRWYIMQEPPKADGMPDQYSIFIEYQPEKEDEGVDFFGPYASTLEACQNLKTETLIAARAAYRKGEYVVIDCRVRVEE